MVLIISRQTLNIDSGDESSPSLSELAIVIVRVRFPIIMIMIITIIFIIKVVRPRLPNLDLRGLPLFSLTIPNSNAIVIVLSGSVSSES